MSNALSSMPAMQTAEAAPQHKRELMLAQCSPVVCNLGHLLTEEQQLDVLGSLDAVLLEVLLDLLAPGPLLPLLG